MSSDACPVCGGPAGSFRFGACSIECDYVTGDPSMGAVGELVAILLLIAGAIGTIAITIWGAR